MDFPELALVQFAPRDLTGPGVEFFARRVAGAGATQTVSATLAPDQTSFERLYMLRWANSMIPVATDIAKKARWYLQLPTIDLPLYGWGGQGFTGALGQREDDTSPAIVIPGGKPLLFVVDFATGTAGNSFDGWIWGYSFPKGNVLSF